MITELPIGRWTQDYKKFLTELEGGDKKEPQIAGFLENHTDTTVHFTISLTDAQAEKLKDQDLYKFFKLESNVSTNNFYLFNEEGHLQHYKTAEEIVEAFYRIRYPLYEKRKQLLLAQYEHSTRMLRNKVRFILAVVNGELNVHNRPRKAILEDLVAMGFDEFPPAEQKALADGTFVSGNELGSEQVNRDGEMQVEEDHEEDSEEDEGDRKTKAKSKAKSKSKASTKDNADAATSRKSGKGQTANLATEDHLLTPGVKYDASTTLRSSNYRYLLDMKLWALTMEEVEHLKELLRQEEEALEKLRATPIKQMWEEDLDDFIEELMNVGELID